MVSSLNIVIISYFVILMSYNMVCDIIFAESLENRIKHYQKKGKFELTNLSDM